MHDPILLGIVPDRLLLSRYNCCNDVHDPIPLGNVPMRLLVPKFKNVSDENDPILLGIEPTIEICPNDILSTLAYVVDPIVESHVTP